MKKIYKPLKFDSTHTCTYCYLSSEAFSVAKNQLLVYTILNESSLNVQFIIHLHAT